VRIPDGGDQRAIMQALLDQGISTRRGVMNIATEQAYAGQGTHRVVGGLERSLAAQESSIILPLFAQLSDEDVHRVVDALGRVSTDTERTLETAL
jgi:dTDP-4-amino-4,6-dideoxygalactose transaminase